MFDSIARDVPYKETYCRADLLDVVRKFRSLGCQAHPTGSALFYNIGKDLDVLIDGSTVSVEALRRAGFVGCSPSEYPDDRQWTGRRGAVNVIVCLQHEYFEAWCRSTYAMCMLAYTGVVLDKDQRGCLFKAVVDEDCPASALELHAYAAGPWGKSYAS